MLIQGASLMVQMFGGSVLGFFQLRWWLNEKDWDGAWLNFRLFVWIGSFAAALTAFGACLCAMSNVLNGSNWWWLGYAAFGITLLIGMIVLAIWRPRAAMFDTEPPIPS